MWKLTPQAVKKEHKEIVDIYIKNGQLHKVEKEHFETFNKGLEITWQQWLILKAVENALIYGKNRISIVSGHGIGKSSCLSILIIWYLFCHYDAQIGATAPTSEQLHDVLWKEVMLWLGKMPKEIGGMFDWQGGYIRVKERPETWFARARTARKEAPEAIAGLHGDYVMIIADEAAGVPDEIYRSAEGSMTGPNVITILIGNGTRNAGYFYETHTDDREKMDWERLSFNAEDSPIVTERQVQKWENKYGRNSDEFKIRVLGQFPASEQMDERGWIPLLVKGQIGTLIDGIPFVGRKIMGVDPAGEGDDMTVWVMRDNYQTRVVATETTSNSKSIAMKTLELVKEFEMRADDVIIDNFGVGANVSAELLLLDHKMHVTAMNWGDDADDGDVYLNKRAECCFRARDWFVRGGSLIGDELKRDLLAYMYTNTLSGKRKIIDKPKLKKKLMRSPDRADALLMTFYADLDLKKINASDMVRQTTKKDLFGAV